MTKCRTAQMSQDVECVCTKQFVFVAAKPKTKSISFFTVWTKGPEPVFHSSGPSLILVTQCRQSSVCSRITFWPPVARYHGCDVSLQYHLCGLQKLNPILAAGSHWLWGRRTALRVISVALTFFFILLVVCVKKATYRVLIVDCC